jgi:hypothetical protein
LKGAKSSTTSKESDNEKHQTVKTARFKNLSGLTTGLVKEISWKVNWSKPKKLDNTNSTLIKTSKIKTDLAQ